MDPCSFMRILIGNFSLKFPVAGKPSGSGIHPSSSSCFCKIKLHGFPHQLSTMPLTSPDPHSQFSLAACFSLNSSQIDKLFKKSNVGPCLKIEVYTGSSTGCGFNSPKLLGRILLPLDLKRVESKPSVFHNGWVSIGKKSNKDYAQLFLSVRAEPDPRFVFQFDGEPECSPQVFQIQGNVRQAVFTCKFGFRHSCDRNLRSRSSISEPSTSKSCLPFTTTEKDRHSSERKWWSITIHDLSGSPVAMASMVTPYDLHTSLSQAKEGAEATESRYDLSFVESD